jgi:hypothetical protein
MLSPFSNGQRLHACLPVFVEEALTRAGKACYCLLAASCSFGLSATSQQYFSLRTNQPSATSQQYFSLRTNQHQPSATSQPNRLFFC